MYRLQTITIPELKTGDCIIFEKRSGIALMEQIFTRNLASHCGIITIINDTCYVYESIAKGFVPRKIMVSILDKANNVYIQRPLFDINKQLIINGCKEDEGTKYYYGGLIYQLKHQIWGGWEGSKDLSKGAYCSAMVEYQYNKQIPNLFPDWYKDAPADLWENRLDFNSYRLIY